MRSFPVDALRSVAAAVLASVALTAALPVVGAQPEAGTSLAERHPDGSIRSRDDIAAARAAAREAELQAQATWQAREAECYSSFFVNGCLETARRAHRDAEREVRRVRVEANTLERQLDARARAEAREGQAPAESAEQRAARESRARDDWQARQQGAEAAAAERAQREQDAAARRAAQAERESEAAAREARRAAAASQRVESARQYDERQRRAAEHARKKEAERVANERRRAERAAERAGRSEAPSLPSRAP